MKLPVLDASGAQVREIDVDEAVFGIAPNLAVVHQALLAQLANQRQGTHSSQTRSMQHSSTVKTRKQKGTGAARLGSRSSPLRRGGAVAHGPHPRSYRQRLPKRMRRLAIRSLLSQRVAEAGLLVLGQEEFQPRTRAVADLLKALGVARRGLVVTDGPNEALHRGIRNLDQMHACPAHVLNVDLLLRYDHIIMTEAGVRRAEALWGGEKARSRRTAAGAGEEA